MNERGHFGGIDQAVWLILLLIFVIVLLRLLGVAVVR